MLCPVSRSPLTTFSTVDQSLPIGQGPNRIQMAHTSLFAFPKLSHTSINSPFIHRGCCSRLEPVAERRVTRTERAMWRGSLDRSGVLWWKVRAREIHSPTHSALPSNLQPVLPIGSNPESQREESPSLWCERHSSRGSGHSEKNGGVGSGLRKTQYPPPPPDFSRGFCHPHPLVVPLMF